MSVKIMGMVWDCSLPRDMKFILLAYADHADHEGKSIYPAVATIMKKTGYSERSVQAITRKLVEYKYLIEDGYGPHGTNCYAVNVAVVCGGAKFAGVQKTTKKSKKGGAKNGAKTAPDPSLNPSLEEQPSEGTPSGDPTPTPQQQMVEVLASVSGFDIRLHGARLGKTASKLVKAGYGAGFVEDNYAHKTKSWWYREDWRGKKGERPTPEQVAETIGKIIPVASPQQSEAEIEATREAIRQAQLHQPSEEEKELWF